MKKAVLFDVDSTLLDTYNFVFDALKHTMGFHKQPYPSEVLIKKAMDKPIKEFYNVLVPDLDADSSW